jgi:hypothetical protein
VTSLSRLARFLVAVVALIAMLIIVLAPPDARVAILRIGLLLGGTTVAAVYLRRSGSVTRSTPERFEAELQQTLDTPPGVPGIRAVEMAVRLSTASAQDFEVRLKPMLRELAGWRLLGNRGVDMDGKPDAARRMLGEPLGRLVDVTAGAPPFGARGVSLTDLDAGLDQLERI